MTISLNNFINLILQYLCSISYIGRYSLILFNNIIVKYLGRGKPTTTLYVPNVKCAVRNF